MTLKVMDLVSLRLRVVQDVESGMSVRQAAAWHGASKTQVYEWLGRYRTGGLAGLSPASRRPLRSPRQLPVDIEDEIVRLRKGRPRWGAKKIRAVLTRSGWPAPSVSTVHRVLVRRGLVDVRAGRRPPPGGWQRFERAHSNELWQIDGTQHRYADGTDFWVVDLVDDHSRFLLGALVTPALTGDAAWSAVRTAVGEYGLPRQMLSDNGLCFTGRAQGTTAAFERRVRAAGIELIHSRAYHPQTNGKVERQHRTQNDWLEDNPPPANAAAAAALIAAYRHDYNHNRPHEAIGQQTPAECYQPGVGVDLPGTDIEPADTYPAGCERRRVRADGTISYQQHKYGPIRLDTRWADVEVGIIRKRGQLHVYYGSATIATIIIGDQPDRRPPAKPKLSGMS
jgi:transposase InsO family protein